MTEKKEYQISIHEKYYNPEYDEGDSLGTLDLNLLLSKIEDNIYCVEEAVGGMTTLGVGVMPFRYKDTVELKELDDGRLHFLKVLEKSNYRSFFYNLETNINVYEHGKNFLDKVILHGGQWEMIGRGLTITLPPNSDLDTDTEVPITVDLCLQEDKKIELTARNIEEAIKLILDHLKIYFETLQSDEEFMCSKDLRLRFLSNSLHWRHEGTSVSSNKNASERENPLAKEQRDILLQFSKYAKLNNLLKPNQRRYLYSAGKIDKWFGDFQSKLVKTIDTLSPLVKNHELSKELAVIQVFLQQSDANTFDETNIKYESLIGKGEKHLFNITLRPKCQLDSGLCSYLILYKGTDHETKDFQIGQIEIAEILSKIMKALDVMTLDYSSNFRKSDINSVYFEGLRTKTLKVNDINVSIE